MKKLCLKIPNLKETDIEIQEAQRAPNKLNPNRPTPRHIIINAAKVKERILKAAKKHKALIIREPPYNFSTETLQARGEWQGIFRVLKEKKL